MIYLFTVMIHWELEIYHVNQSTNEMFWTISETEGKAGPVKSI